MHQLKIPNLKIIISFLTLLFILISIPLAFRLAQERQEIRKRAAEDGTLEGACRPELPKCDGNLRCVTNICMLNGCCSSDGDCASWEKCDISNGACGSGKSCRSTSGCAQDSDCGPGRKCQNGNCQGVGQATIQCSANSGGVRVFCDSCTDSDSFNVSISYFLAGIELEHSAVGKNQCTTNPFVGGAETTINKTISKTQEWSSSRLSLPQCGVWQTDVKVIYSGNQVCIRSDHGCNWNDAACMPQPTPTPTSSPTNPPSSTPIPTVSPSASPTPSPSISPNICLAIFAYDTNWNIISNLSTIRAGQTVYFSVKGTRTQDITKARFRFTIGAAVGNWQETTTKRNDEFYISYTIPYAATYKVEAMLYNLAQDWF